MYVPSFGSVLLTIHGIITIVIIVIITLINGSTIDLHIENHVPWYINISCPPQIRSYVCDLQEQIVINHQIYGNELNPIIQTIGELSCT